MKTRKRPMATMPTPLVLSPDPTMSSDERPSKITKLDPSETTTPEIQDELEPFSPEQSLIAKTEPKLKARPVMMRRCPVKICSHESSTESALIQHIQAKHRDIPPYGCTIDGCQDRFETNKELRSHSKSIHPIPRQTRWTCHLADCNMSFDSSAKMVSHAKKSHPGVKRKECKQQGCYVAVSTEEEMDRHIFNSHKDKAFLCRVESCSRVFPHITAEGEHWKVDHEKKLYACQAQGCTETFPTTDKKLKHMKKKHPDELFFECVAYNCKERFKTRKKMQAHLRDAHPKSLIDCAEKDCPIKFPSTREMLQHFRLIHKSECHTCSFENCDHFCTTKSGIYQHERDYHGDKTKLCPYRDCEAAFTSIGNLNRHIKGTHNGEPLNCVFDDCFETFANVASRNRHISRLHHGRPRKIAEYPCRLEAKEGCEAVFSDEKMLSMHLNTVHRGKVPCRYALECNCDLIFTDTDQELPHALRFHSFHMCNVTNCVNAVSQRWINGHSMAGHLRRHRQFTGDEIPASTKIIPGDSKWEEVSQQQEDYDPLDAENPTADDTDLALVDEDELAIFDPEHDAYGWSYSPCDLEADDVQACSVRQRNDRLLQRFPDSNHILGLRCVGPDPVIRLITGKKCPTNAVLTYDTANLKMQSSTATLLARRCVQCDGEFNFYSFLKKYDILADHGLSQCSHQSCFNVLFRGSRFCQKHFHDFLPEREQLNAAQIKDLHRRWKLATESRWTAQPKMKAVLELMAQIRSGKAEPSKLIFLDLEFSASTLKVFEIGMCDGNGNVTMDCLTKYSPRVEYSKSTIPVPRLNQIGFRLQNLTKHHNCADGAMTAPQVANMLRKKGVTKDTLFVTWHLSTMDLRALRQWLEEEGEHDVLPADSYCVPVISHFRENLRPAKSGKKDFPCRLPVIFPLLMGLDHPLSGRNHHAAVDAQQLYHMIDIFNMLCKPSRDRPKDWLKGVSGTSSKGRTYQVSIKEFLTKA